MADTAITARHPRFDWQQPRRHWLDGRPGLTHVCNALHLLFPPAERWFAQVANQQVRSLQDPQLAAATRGFMAQEGSHARAHASFLGILEAQGFELADSRKFLDNEFAKASRHA